VAAIDGKNYVGWTRNSWKLLETVSPEELALAVRLLHIEYGNSVRPSGEHHFVGCAD